MRSPALLACGLICALTLGCAGYRVGPTNGIAARSRTITLKPFENATMEPRLGQAVTTALRRTIQRDGTYELETKDGADIVVHGKILKYERSALTFDPRDILTARDMEVRVTAHVVATDISSGKQLFERDVYGRTTLRLADNMASVERQAAPVVAEDLARNITELLVDGAW